MIYADFEAITEKISSCQPNNDKSYTEAYQKHTDCGYGYRIVCCYDDKYSKPATTYRGKKAVHKFMEAMLEEVKYCKRVMKKEFNKPLRMTKDDEEKFQKAEKCHICDKKCTDKDIRVRDHCHITGKYRGSAHQECNLNLRVNSEEIKIPVIFHNLRGYDSHFIMQEIGGPCVIRPFHFQFRKKMKFYFLFVLFIISSRFFETKLPYCRINADILNTKFKLLLYLTQFCYFQGFR